MKISNFFNKILEKGNFFKFFIMDDNINFFIACYHVIENLSTKRSSFLKNYPSIYMDHSVYRKNFEIIYASIIPESINKLVKRETISNKVIRLTADCSCLTSNTCLRLNLDELAKPR